MTGIVLIPFILILLVGPIVLQVFLSKTESPIPGLIIPIISFLIATAVPLFTVSDGIFTFFDFLFTWLLAQIPTIIYLGIYFGCRPKKKKDDSLNKMDILDL